MRPMAGLRFENKPALQTEDYNLLVFPRLRFSLSA